MRSLPGLPFGAKLVPPTLLALASALPAQVVRGVFVTPIPDAPFSATVNLERTEILADGTTVHLRSACLIARDQAGRIYNEARPLAPASATAAAPISRIHVYDPQNRMSVFLYPANKMYRVTILDRPPRGETVEDYASPPGRNAAPSGLTQQEDLGEKTLSGLPVHGVRVTQTLTAAESGTGAEVVVTNEYWYSDALRMNLETRRNDPRTGSVTTTVTQIHRTEPDAALF